MNGENIYRIKAISTTGSSVYSNMVSIGAEVSRKSVLKVMGNTLYLLCELGGDYTGAVCMYNTAGQVLYKKPVNLSKGAKMVELPTSIRRHSACVIIVLYLDGQVTLTQKLLW